MVILVTHVAVNVKVTNRLLQLMRKSVAISIVPALRVITLFPKWVSQSSYVLAAILESVQVGCGNCIKIFKNKKLFLQDYSLLRRLVPLKLKFSNFLFFYTCYLSTHIDCKNQNLK